MHNTRVTRVIVFLLICLLALFPFPQHLWHHLLVYSRNPDFIISCKPLLFHPCNELVYSHRTNTPTPLPFYLIIFRNSVLYSELLCLCGIRMLQINCSSTYIQVVTWTPPLPIWPGQKSCTWPIFELDVTLDLNYNCTKFHHSTSTRSWVIVRTDRRTDGHIRQSHEVFWWTPNKMYSLLAIHILHEIKFKKKIRSSWKVNILIICLCTESPNTVAVYDS